MGITKWIPKLLMCLLCINSVYAGSKKEQPVVLRGQWIQGGIVFGKLKEPNWQVFVDEKKLLITDEGEFVFGIGRDYPKTLQIKLIDSKSQIHTQAYSVTQRQYNIQKVEGVKQKLVEPPAEVIARIQQEAALVRAARARNDKRDDFSHPFLWPLIGPVTGVYGSQRYYNGIPKSPHYGLDIAAPTGTKVAAPAAGIITLAEPDLYFSGGTIILDHGHNLSSTFLHLSKVLVKVGDRVGQGDLIAEVGATGRATGPHLDWRMNWSDQRVDPQLLMVDTPMPNANKNTK